MRVYEELWDEELNDEKDIVLSHRLVNHRFILELFSISSKFVSRDMADILRSILMNRNDMSMEWRGICWNIYNIYSLKFSNIYKKYMI